MGKVKQLWQDKIDNICFQYEIGEINHTKATAKLLELGLSYDYVFDLLTEIRLSDN